jgi:hypothetical protein
MTKQTRRSTTPGEVANIYILLREHLEIVRPADDEHPDALVAYKNDMDDEKIAKLVSPTLTTIHVRNIRRKEYGDLFRRRTILPVVAADKSDILALSNVLYQVISILSRDNLMSGEEETDLTEIVDSVVKSVRKG